MQLTQEKQELIQKNLRYLQLLSQEYPTIAVAASEVINQEAVLRLPKGTEHFMSDLHGENEAFRHVLNSASGVIREKVDAVLAQENATPEECQEFATLIYYPEQKLPLLKAAQGEENLDYWYEHTLLRLIELCRLVSSKHTRARVRRCLPNECAHILDELLHAHFEDHNKEMYYDEIIISMIENGQADDFIIHFCKLIKRLAVDKLHIVGDLYDRGPRPDRIVDTLMNHHNVDIQWGNHDTVWMGAAAGSPICIATVLKTALSYANVETLEEGYGLNLRRLGQFADEVYGDCDLSIWMPKGDNSRFKFGHASLRRSALMHIAISVIMFKLECQVIDRNPDFQMQDRDFIRRINYQDGTVKVNGITHFLRDTQFPTVDPQDPARLTEREAYVMEKLVESFRESEKLQRHVRFMYKVGHVYHVENGNLMFHGCMPMTMDGEFAEEVFDGKSYRGKALFDFCEERARDGYFAPEGSPERQKGQDFLWYLWCGKLSPIFGRSAMTTFEHLYISDKSTHTEEPNAYYKIYDDVAVADKILAEFGLYGEGHHIVNGHVPVKVVKGESPVKGGGKILVIDGGFCRAYHDRTGIAGYTLVFNSRTLSLRTHEPFESTQKAIEENVDIHSDSRVIYECPRRLRVKDVDWGTHHRDLADGLKLLMDAYRSGILKESTRPGCGN